MKSEEQKISNMYDFTGQGKKVSDTKNLKNSYDPSSFHAGVSKTGRAGGSWIAVYGLLEKNFGGDFRYLWIPQNQRVKYWSKIYQKSQPL